MNSPKRTVCWAALVLALTGLLSRAQDKEPTVDGKTLAEWRTLLKDKDFNQRYRAIKAIGQFGPDARDVAPELAALIKAGFNKSLQQAAAESLGKLGSVALPTALEL